MSAQPSSIPVPDAALRNALIYLAAATIDLDFSDPTIAAAASARSLPSPSSPSSLNPLASMDHTPTQRFVFDVVMRTQSTFNDVQLALYYLGRFRADRSRSQQHTKVPPAFSDDRSRLATPPPEPHQRRCTPTRTPAAACHLHDTPYTARVWSSLTGLPLATINAAEREVLAGLGYRLHVDPGRSPSPSPLLPTPSMEAAAASASGGGFAGFCWAAVRIAGALARAGICGGAAGGAGGAVIAGGGGMDDRLMLAGGGSRKRKRSAESRDEGGAKTIRVAVHY
ncbi:hypothetical protein DFJ73DRAFT_870922 [Zopfochytrium polystomum]|nr:hypothetical protein DFJ73DRAFT_870922 [Zopfochytrium polystomum]